MSVFSYSFFVRYHLRNGVSEAVFSKLRPSVQEPIAMVSVDFASPEVTGSKKGHSIIATFYLTISRFCFAKTASYKKVLPPVKTFRFLKKCCYQILWYSLTYPFFLDFPTPFICMAEGVRVLSYPFFLEFNRKRGFWEIVCSELRLCVRGAITC